MKIIALDFKQSLSRQKLIFKASLSYKLDLFFQIFMNVALWLIIGVNFVYYASYDRNQKSFIYTFIVFACICNYLLYLKLREKRLSILPSNNTAAFNRNRILALAMQEDWSIRKDSKGIIIAFEDCGDRGLGNTKELTRVFLLSGNEVFFTIFTERRRVNFPSPFTRAHLKSDLKKVLITT